MTAPRVAETKPCVALFDLDGTLTWRDTLLPFLFGYALRSPSRMLRLWRLPGAVVGYFSSRCDRGLLKSRLIRAVMGGEPRSKIDAWSEAFVGTLKSRGAFRPAALAMLEAHRAAGHHLVLLSASPDLYVPRIGELLGFERTLCTELQWHSSPSDDRLDGALRTPNRRGEEKSRCLAWLRTQYTDMPVVAYGNSGSDLPHLRQADRALLVNARADTRRSAAASGIPVGSWT
ncbi:MAG TPA: HAD-IB family phosphatase [Steroidobacteraceae bacterium]|nr:HAD-IB family phosphatase [Steroidobacteraceae bacterium]